MDAQTKKAVEPEKLDLRSLDPAVARTEELARLFPEARTEGGKIDFDQLKRVLGETVDPGRERYGLVWPGKSDCFKTIQAPSVATLRPASGESVNFDATDNLIIEGDNLEVLKLLQKSYLGKVRMIYIDPPYNTGNDFIYPDNYAESLQTYLEYTGQVDSEGRKFGTNTEADGRFHSKWLNMMYPRLYLARNLLREDGTIFVSCDDNEICNLRAVMNEIFGEENFIATLVWERGRKNDARRFSVGHEYIVGYAANSSYIEEVNAPWREPKVGVSEIIDEYQRLKQEYKSDYTAISEGLVRFYQSLPPEHPSKKYSRSRFVDGRGIWRDNNISWPGGGGPKYDVIHPVTKKACKVPDDGWRFIEPTMKLKIETGYVQFREDHTKSPILKSYLYVEPSADLQDEEAGDKLQVMGSVFYRHSQPSNDVIKELFGEKIFENPKDHVIIARLIRYCTSKDDLVLDFFAGSGTAGHAVLELNHRDGGNRKFVLVQLPEPTGRADYPTIADIARERIRRVIKMLKTEGNGKLEAIDNSSQRGFRSFKLDESNFRTWDAKPPADVEALEQQLALHIDHVRDKRGAEDILYEILLKSGFQLAAKVEKLSLGSLDVFSVAGDALLICLERKLTLDAIRAMAERKPERVVCLDEGFAGNDQLKTNAVQTFKSKGIVFRTV